jgi:hypothetical protein
MEKLEKDPEFTKAPDESKKALIASAAEPVLKTSMMNISPLAFVASETEVEEALGRPMLNSTETCRAKCTAIYIAEEAGAAGAYVVASSGCAASAAIPIVGPFIAAACVAGASTTYVAAHVALSIRYANCCQEC